MGQGLLVLKHRAEIATTACFTFVEYSVVQLPEGNRWRWEVRFGDGKTKTGVTPVSRAVAIKQAKSAIDHFLRDTK